MFFFRKPKFQVARGVHPASLEGVIEAYEVAKKDSFTQIIVNISAEKIWTSFLQLLQLVDGPGFGILEIPTNSNDLPPGAFESGEIYNDHYHLPQVDRAEFLKSLAPVAEWVVHDGLIQCGFGSHQKMDEVFIGPYKTFYIYSVEPQKYVAELEKMGLREVADLRVPRSGNTEAAPGWLEAIEIEGKDFYALIENQLKPKGWFLYEQKPAL